MISWHSTPSVTIPIDTNQLPKLPSRNDEETWWMSNEETINLRSEHSWTIDVETTSTQNLWDTHSTFSNTWWWQWCTSDFISICWVKDIDITEVSVLEIRWRAKSATPRILYCRNHVPYLFTMDSSCKLFLLLFYYESRNCVTHPQELINYRPIL